MLSQHLGQYGRNHNGVAIGMSQKARPDFMGSGNIVRIVIRQNEDGCQIIQQVFQRDDFR
jgi:hypothetical protein